MKPNQKQNNHQFHCYTWIILIVYTQFIGFYNMIAPSTQIYYTDMISIILLIINMFFMIFVLKGKIKISKSNKIERSVVSLALLVILLIIYSIIRYYKLETVGEVFKESMHYISAIFTFFILVNLAKNFKDVEFFIDTIVKISLLCSLVAVIAFVLLDRFNYNVLNFNTTTYSFYRRGSARFNIGMMVYIPGVIFACVKFINKKSNVIDKLAIIFGIIHIVVISKTRSILIWLILSLLFYFVFSKSKSKKIVGIFAITVIGLFILTMINSVSIAVSEMLLDNSFAYRIQAINFYWNQILANPILGMGLLGTSNNNLSTLLYGPLNRFYRVDVGIIGFINEMGICGLLWISNYTVRNIRLIIKCTSRFNKHKELCDYYKCLLLYVTFSSVNLFFLNPGLIFEFVLCLFLGFMLENVGKGIME